MEASGSNGEQGTGSLAMVGLYWAFYWFSLAMVGLYWAFYWFSLAMVGLYWALYWFSLAMVGVYWAFYWFSLVMVGLYWAFKLCLLKGSMISTHDWTLSTMEVTSSCTQKNMQSTALSMASIILKITL